MSDDNNDESLDEVLSQGETNETKELVEKMYICKRFSKAI